MHRAGLSPSMHPRYKILSIHMVNSASVCQTQKIRALLFITLVAGKVGQPQAGCDSSLLSGCHNFGNYTLQLGVESLNTCVFWSSRKVNQIKHFLKKQLIYFPFFIRSGLPSLLLFHKRESGDGHWTCSGYCSFSANKHLTICLAVFAVLFHLHFTLGEVFFLVLRKLDTCRFQTRVM